MNAATWVEQTIEEFGQMLGFDELVFDERGVIQLDIEDRGVLTLELQDDAVLVYLARTIFSPSRTALRHALQLCHHSESDQPWLQAALLGEGRLAFALRIPDREFHSATLEEAIATLTHLHDALAEEAAV